MRGRAVGLFAAIAGVATFGFAGAAYALPTPPISTTQQPASAAIGSSIADSANVSGVPTVVYLCPPTDLAGRALQSSNSTGGLTCIYQTTPNDYFCVYFSYDGLLKQDHDAGFCPPVADVGMGEAIPTGTVTFNLYDNPNGTGTPLFTDTEPLSGGSATSKWYTATARGTDYWVATYSGDSNYNSVSSSNSGEPVTISAATPAINTTQQPATATVGSSIADQATVSGGDNPTGTVTFTLYDNPNGTGTPLFKDTEPLSGGSATSRRYTTTATGTADWVATYNGDSANSSVSTGTGLEPVAIGLVTPSISTTQKPASAVVGSSIADQATVSGGFNPTGTVTFTLYDNPNGTGTPLFTSTESLVTGGATSAAYRPSVAGTYYWVAIYNGDPNNNSVSSAQTAEPVRITPHATNGGAPPPMRLSDAQRHARSMIQSRLHRTSRMRSSCKRISNSAWHCRLTWTAGVYSYTAVGRFYNSIGSTGNAYWSYDFKVTRTSIACVRRQGHSARCSKTFHWH